MRVFVGLDGGGTGCRGQAELEDGRRTAILSGGAANVHSDPKRALQQISTILAQACEQARAMLPTGAQIEPVVALSLAGASESGAASQLRAALPYAQLIVRGDIDASLVGAFQDADGIVMAVGTGSVLACQRGGRRRRLGGYGFILGDEGSGAWLGREALRRSLHARDGLGPNGPLTQAIWKEFVTLTGIIGFAGRARPADYAALAPLVLEHDREGCPLARGILDEGCAYLLRAITQLQQGAGDMPVAPMGGLGPSLLDRIVAGHGAQLRVVTPKGTALDGALWLARNSAGTQEQMQ